MFQVFVGIDDKEESQVPVTKKAIERAQKILKKYAKNFNLSKIRYTVFQRFFCL